MRIAIALAFATVVLGSTGTARAEIGVETDPTNLVLGGGSLLVELAPAAAPHWRFGAVAFTSTLPSFAVEDGWSKVRIELGVGADAHYYVGRGRGGLFAGAQVGMNWWKYTSDAGATATNAQLGLMPQIGYHWFPSARHGFYLKPWAGVGIPLHTSRDAVADGMTYKPSIPVTPFISLHVGWQL